MKYPCKDRGGYRNFNFFYKTNNIVYYHLGHDFNCDLGDDVISIKDGKIIFSGQVNGFGGTNKKGGVVIVNHYNFVALYGHMEINKNYNVNDIIKEGDILGKISDYYTIDKNTNKEINVPHLHLGIWLGNDLPPFKWGYDIDRKRWVDPVIYLKNLYDKEKGV